MPECGKLVVYEIGNSYMDRGKLFIIPLEEVHVWMGANDWACPTNQTDDILNNMLYDKRGFGLVSADWNWFIVQETHKDGPLHTGLDRLRDYKKEIG